MSLKWIKAKSVNDNDVYVTNYGSSITAYIEADGDNFRATVTVEEANSVCGNLRYKDFLKGELFEEVEDAQCKCEMVIDGLTKLGWDDFVSENDEGDDDGMMDL